MAHLTGGVSTDPLDVVSCRLLTGTLEDILMIRLLERRCYDMTCRMEDLPG